MDTVFIEGLEVAAIIGVHDWERRIRQVLRFDIEMAFDNRPPAASDSLSDALDYHAVSQSIVQCVQHSRDHLIETLAERCAMLVQDKFGVTWLRLKLSKLKAVPGSAAVGIVIERGSR